ncbi:NAD-dependent epimerase/dehydratase family protein [Bradyrhizobium sp.]|uniref:NAD-dependent epimerase/dehydratase family protein n=1 Tax=Bradyrhizobium sp. TaxID=376 RepID=UPI003C706329
MISHETVFITGGAGFIGATLAARLVEDNNIIVFDNFARNSLQTSGLMGHKNLTVINGDIRDTAAVMSAVLDAKPDRIVHCAAIAGIDTVVRSPTATLDVNIVGTANIFQAARKLGSLKRILSFSTSEIFGSHAFQTTELSSAVIGAVGEARWTYAVSKLAGEHMALAHFHEFKMPAVVVRPFNVYGPGQVGEGALSTFIKRAIRNDEIQIHGDGSQIRAWCYVDDMARALLLALEHPAAIGQTFNIGNARAVITIYGLANTVIRVLGSTSKIRFVRKDYADIELRVPNINKARDLLDFEARIDLDEGILRTAEYYRGVAI